jgi:hypothetical protein
MSICSSAGCVQHTAPRSKYCAVHKSEARAAWFEMVREKSAQRAADKSALTLLVSDAFNHAHSAGFAAGIAADVEPIGLVTGMFCPGDKTPHYISSGICGFAWVDVKGARGLMRQSFIDAGFSESAYKGGLSYWVGAFGTSYDRKSAYADAFALSLRLSVKRWASEYPSAAKLEITSGSRID